MWMQSDMDMHLLTLKCTLLRRFCSIPYYELNLHIKRKRARERDDEIAVQHKQKAGSATFRGWMAAVHCSLLAVISFQFNKGATQELHEYTPLLASCLEGVGPGYCSLLDVVSFQLASDFPIAAASEPQDFPLYPYQNFSLCRVL